MPLLGKLIVEGLILSIVIQRLTVRVRYSIAVQWLHREAHLNLACLRVNFPTFKNRLCRNERRPFSLSNWESLCLRPRAKR